MSKITIEQTVGYDLTVTDLQTCFNIRQKQASIFIDTESIPALISALDPERDKQWVLIEVLKSEKRVLQSQLEEAKKLLAMSADTIAFVNADGMQSADERIKDINDFLSKLNTKQP